MTPVGTLSGSTVSSDDGTLRDQPGFQITPKGDRQFARQGDDHDAPDAPLLTLGAVMEPHAQGTVRLMPEPKAMPLRPWPPGPADCPPWRCLGCGVRRRCHRHWARSRYSSPPAVYWRSADNRPPAWRVEDKSGPRPLRRNRSWRLRSVATQDVAGVITLMLDVDDLRLHLGQSLDLPAETFRQGPAVPRHQFRRGQGLSTAE